MVGFNVQANANSFIVATNGSITSGTNHTRSWELFLVPLELMKLQMGMSQNEVPFWVQKITPAKGNNVCFKEGKKARQFETYPNVCLPESDHQSFLPL